MSQTISETDSALQRRMHVTARRLAGMTHEQVLDSMRNGAQAVAEHLNEQGIPIKSRRFRPDVGPVQIDMIVIEETVTKPEPAMRLQFEVEGGMGVTLNIKLLEFIKDPAAYVRDIMQQLGPMRRNVVRLRNNKRELNSRMYEALTQGAANG
ncbi:MAG: hypothetical protein ACQEW0_16465 [Pseudomonadota bacterium]